MTTALATASTNPAMAATGSARACPVADREAAQRRQHRLGGDRDRHHRHRGSAPERRCVGDQADDHEHRADGVGGRAVVGEARHRGPGAERDSGDHRQHRWRRRRAHDAVERGDEDEQADARSRPSTTSGRPSVVPVSGAAVTDSSTRPATISETATLRGSTEPLTQQPGGQHGGDADARRQDPLDGEQRHLPGGDRGQHESDEVEPGAEQVDRARQDVPRRDGERRARRRAVRRPSAAPIRRRRLSARSDGDQCSEHRRSYTKICDGGGKPLKFEA